MYYAITSYSCFILIVWLNRTHLLNIITVFHDYDIIVSAGCNIKKSKTPTVKRTIHMLSTVIASTGHNHCKIAFVDM